MLKIRKCFVVIIVVFYTTILVAQQTNSFVKIGTQVWTTENLSVVTFRNGDTIPVAKTDSDWARAGRQHKPAWCYYNNSTTSGKTYGKLYNGGMRFRTQGVWPLKVGIYQLIKNGTL